jgi:hypothetical protein
MQTAIVSPSHEPNGPHDASDEPQEQADKIYPNSILHPLHPRVHLRFLVNIHRSKEAKHSAPEDKEDNIPGEKDCYGHVREENGKNHEDESRDGRERADNGSEDLKHWA